VADAVVDTQRNGLFPRPGKEYASVNSICPLALLHLADRLEARPRRLPRLVPDVGYWHNRFTDKSMLPEGTRTGPYNRITDSAFY
jgi:hypothetical protein